MPQHGNSKTPLIDARRRLIVAPRQLPLAKSYASVNHQKTRLPLLIQIDAPFSPRLSRYKTPDRAQRRDHNSTV
jgi:hypothetical protein